MALSALPYAVLARLPSIQDGQQDTADVPGAADALRDFPGFLSEHWPWLLSRAAIFFGTILVFWFVARLARRAVRGAMSSERIKGSHLLEDTVVSLTGKIVMLLGVVLAFSFIGVELGPILAGLGIAGFVLGFALQETLGNFAAGAMILLYAPFDVGDAVEVAGVTGTVVGMSLVSTTINTFDNQRVIVPNGKIWGDVIKNITAEATRRVDMVFGIAYEDDIPQAEQLLQRIVAEHPKVLDEPGPVIKLSELADSSVNFIVRPWCRTEDYWDVRWDITREVKLVFDAEGISIPYPQRDVHLHPVDGQGAAG